MSLSRFPHLRRAVTAALGAALVVGTLLGGLGVSGDMSCADHNIAWKTRFNLGLDHVPAGVSPPPAYDNIINDLTGVGADQVGPSGFGHPTCTAGTTAVSQALPTAFPIGHWNA